MRELKFRIWDSKNKRFVYFEGIFNELNDTNLIGEIGQQYTGLKDKNNLKEVYEGDIIKYDRHDDPVIIRWTEEGMDYTGWIFEDLFTQGGPFEVIGNIFENSELLEK